MLVNQANGFPNKEGKIEWFYEIENCWCGLFDFLIHSIVITASLKIEIAANGLFILQEVNHMFALLFLYYILSLVIKFL